jgi:hypothetical protein
MKPTFIMPPYVLQVWNDKVHIFGHYNCCGGP